MFKSIVIAGVGGQGTLLASKILSAAAHKRGLFVRTSETIGMAQRGGSVSSHLRIGSERVSPVIPQRHADILIGFELAEAVRQIPKLVSGAAAVINIDSIIPVNVALKQGKYLGEEYLSLLKAAIPGALLLSGTPLALASGDIRTLNIVLLGAAVGAGILPFSEGEIRGAIKECVRPKLFEMNSKAFDLGVKSAG